MTHAKPLAAVRLAGVAGGVVPIVLGCAGAGDPRGLEVTMSNAVIEPQPVLFMESDRRGSGPPIVLIGGGLTGWSSWQPHAERLTGTREVVRLQLVSVQYGLEDRPLPAGYSLRMESRALAAALDRIGWTDPIDLVAWSYGAAITLDFALSHPERVRTLTLIEPPAFWLLSTGGREWPDVQELQALVPRVQDEVGTAALETFVRNAGLLPPGATPESLPQWSSWVQHRRSLRNIGATLAHTDDIERLRAFDRPVLLVTGTGTTPGLRAVHDALAATLPNARTLELPGAHAPQLVAMDDFLARLAAFQENTQSSARMHTVRSADGTRIAFWQSGKGPALLLVHGATADHGTTWRLALPHFERRFTVYAMDRRGRGGSGDAADYDLQREAEDVAAVVDAIGGPVDVLGHSYGALAAIEAARLTPDVRRLILYEGVPLRGEGLYPPGIAERLDALRAAGDTEGMLITMYRDLVEMPPDELELLRSQRAAWATRLHNMATLPRELATEQRYVFEPERFASMRTPTLLLVGGDSPPREEENARSVAAALPDARVDVLPGQQHAAMHTAPERFVNAVTRFLEGR